MSNKIKQHSNEPIRMPKQNPISIFLNPTNYSEIAKIIKDMRKSGGVDNINTKTIKSLSRYIINILVHICNLTIEKLTWPEALKCADIIPIYKSKDKNCVENYSPISLITNLAKILE